MNSKERNIPLLKIIILIYQGGSLCVYMKKSNISEIPLDIEMKYWNKKV